jgi:hypothetical protein
MEVSYSKKYPTNTNSYGITKNKKAISIGISSVMEKLGR